MAWCTASRTFSPVTLLVDVMLVDLALVDVLPHLADRHQRGTGDGRAYANLRRGRVRARAEIICIRATVIAMRAYTHGSAPLLPHNPEEGCPRRPEPVAVFLPAFRVALHLAAHAPRRQ